MYLKNSTFLPAALAKIIDGIQTVENGQYSVSLSPDNAEQLRSEFTMRLAKTGFDIDYEATAEGEMLEGLIDRFYLENE